MIRALVFILLLLPVSSCESQSKDDLGIFYSKFSDSKADVFMMLMESFDRFLNENFDEQKSLNEKIREFLEIIIEDKKRTNWDFEKYHIQEAIQKMDNSGTRQELYLYQGEVYEARYDIRELLKSDVVYQGTENIDTSDLNEDFEDLFPVDQSNNVYDDSLQNKSGRLYFNPKGVFLYGLATAKMDDQFFKDYVVAKLDGVDNPTLIIDAILNNFESYKNDPYLKVILVAEVYYPMILHNSN